MQALERVRRRWSHVVWADSEILEALRTAEEPPSKVVREFAHVIGAEEVWLSRLQGRPARAEVWPSVSMVELEALVDQTHGAYADYFRALSPAELISTVTYTNSAGREFVNAVADVLDHVALHGQYHRGKVNLLLRQSGLTPAPVDFIGYVRGAPAATEADARRPVDGNVHGQKER